MPQRVLICHQIYLSEKLFPFFEVQDNLLYFGWSHFYVSKWDFFLLSLIIHITRIDCIIASNILYLVVSEQYRCFFFHINVVLLWPTSISYWYHVDIDKQWFLQPFFQYHSEPLCRCESRHVHRAVRRNPNSVNTAL